MVIFTQNSNTRGNMPKIYQAHYKDQDKTWRIYNASKTLILAEAKKTAKTFGKEVKVDALTMEKPSMKYLIELMNVRKPNSRKRICSFIPKGRPTIETINGEIKKIWKVKKKICLEKTNEA